MRLRFYRRLEIQIGDRKKNEGKVILLKSGFHYQTKLGDFFIRRCSSHDPRWGLYFYETHDSFKLIGQYHQISEAAKDAGDKQTDYPPWDDCDEWPAGMNDIKNWEQELKWPLD